MGIDDMPAFYLGPVSGSPLLPPGALIIYLLVSAVLTAFFARSKRTLHTSFLFSQILLFVIVGAIAGFYLLPPPSILKTTVSETITIDFDRPVSRAALEKVISPPVPGIWVFENPVYSTHLYRRVVFHPTIANYDPETTYTINLNRITNIFKTSQGKKFLYTFTTPPAPKFAAFTASKIQNQPKIETASDINKNTTKLGVPIYLQQHSLSCEVSALRMALSYRGVNVSENSLLDQLGIDGTPHTGNTWGNPDEKFVGNVNGKQMVDGYGVHWEPIARLARNYRDAQEFQGWTVAQLTTEIKNNNPVEIWVYAGGGYPTTWKTPDGKEIFAYRDEHTVVVVGFVGSLENPTHIIINDPLHGQIYWSRATFDKKWASFGRSGVVIK